MEDRNIPINISDYELDSQFGDEDEEELQELEEDNDIEVEKGNWLISE